MRKPAGEISFYACTSTCRHLLLVGTPSAASSVQLLLPHRHSLQYLTNEHIAEIINKLQTCVLFRNVSYLLPPCSWYLFTTPGGRQSSANNQLCTEKLCIMINIPQMPVLTHNSLYKIRTFAIDLIRSTLELT